MTAGAVLDTSIFTAVGQARQLRRPVPDQISVSVVTLAELELGVLVAQDPAQRVRVSRSGQPPVSA